jgi:two-component system, chemotaxis family, protein-glutamate methylesterase/glutaminase
MPAPSGPRPVANGGDEENDRPRTVVAVGASLGGIGALKRVLGALPADFPAAVVVVQHLSARSRSVLDRVLSPGTRLPVGAARDGERMVEGRVYLAPPGRHLRVNRDGTLSLSDAPAVQFVRPSADVLFASVADAFDGEAVAVVLTGRERDGAGGVVRVHDRGGTVIAQDPAGAVARGMPESSIRTGAVDHVLPLDEIAPALVRLARRNA